MLFLSVTFGEDNGVVGLPVLIVKNGSIAMNENKSFYITNTKSSRMNFGIDQFQLKYRYGDVVKLLNL